MNKRMVIGASAAATIAAAAAATFVGVRRWWRSWGVVPDLAGKALPGDDVVPDGEELLTRAITIDAEPEAVWPWLVQMGYGRAGWYSYDQLDMKGRSAAAILPEFQSVAVGDLVPTHPAGGFEVKVVDPPRALVLFLDGALVEQQATSATESISVTQTPGLAASGRFLQTASPRDFAVTWAFVLEPVGPGRTRLIERMRGRFGPAMDGSRSMLPMLGFGVFVMMRKQMLGIRERVEGAVRTTPPKPPVIDGPDARANGRNRSVPAREEVPV